MYCIVSPRLTVVGCTNLSVRVRTYVFVMAAATLVVVAFSLKEEAARL